MIRDINIKNYVPPFIVDYAEMNQIYSAENIKLNQIETEHWQMIDNRFFVTADIDGIIRFETLLGITALQNDTIEDRRFRIKSLWNNLLPYNYNFLYQKLVSLCGEDGFSILLDCDNYNIQITLELGVANMIADVQKMLNEIIPCNLTMDVLRKYNTYGHFNNMTHGQMKPYTHYQLRNEVV